MYTSIEKSLSPSKKCFVLAGAGHLAKYNPSNEFDKKAIDELHNYLKNKKAAVLINKHSDIKKFFFNKS